MKSIFKLLGNIIFILFIGIYIFIKIGTGGSGKTVQTDDSVARERVVRDRNEPIEMTGRLESKTPEEVFRQTTPYDKGQSIFAGWHTSSNNDDSGSVSNDVTSGAVTVNREFGVDLDLTSAVFHEINTFREHLGVSYLDWDEGLYYYTEIRALEILESGKLSHERPNGDMWYELFYADGYSFYEVAENLADRKYNKIEVYSDANDWVQIWADSPPHYNVMIDSVFTHMAVCVVYGMINNEAVEIAVTIYARY